MGIIAPEHKKKSRARETTGPLAVFIALLVIIAVPFFVIKACTKDSSEVSKAAENKVLNSTEESSNYETYTAPLEYSSSRPQSYRKDSRGLYELTSPVMDTASLLTSSDYVMLTNYLVNLSNTTGVQIAVLTLKSLEGKSIEEVSLSHAEKWNLGKNGVDNGALLTVSLTEHELRIETGYGTEGVLTDVLCSRIIRNVIVPEFRQGNYSTGIVKGVQNMAGIITSDENMISEAVTEDSSSVPLPVLIFMIAFAIFYISIIAFSMRHAKRYGRMGPHVYMGPGFGGMHNTGTHFGGSSHSGGFSGGGGHFGGGGASGRW